jgi:glycosyltransferase involved in cell wall biosynthesis
MPTLLSVNSYYYRRDGSEVVFLEHNRLFKEAGWTVVPFAMQHPENLSTEWGRYFVTELEFGSDYSLLDKLVRIPKVIYSLEARRQIALLIDRTQPDICHCHSIYHHLSPSILGSLRNAGIPVVMTLHDLKIACPAYHMANSGGICEQCKGGRLYNVLVNRCIKGSSPLSALLMGEAILHSALGSYSAGVNVFVAPSRFYIDKLVEWGWSREKFVHVPNSVDVAQLEPAYASGSHFLYFGRLSPEKGLMTLVRAAARSGVSVHLAGHGPQMEELQREVHRLDAPVHFLGHLGGEELIAAIGASRATVLASEWYENAPMSILESYALGKPVIAARIGGIPELLAENHTGWLFESGSVNQLADTLRSVALMPGSAIEQFGRAARRLAEQEYSGTLYRQRIGDLYSRVRGAKRDALQP